MSDEPKLLRNPGGAAVMECPRCQRWHYRLPNPQGEVEFCVSCSGVGEESHLVFVREDDSRMRQDGSVVKEGAMSNERCPDCGSEATTCWDCSDRALAALEADLEAARHDLALLAEQVDAARAPWSAARYAAEVAREVAREVVEGALLYNRSLKFESQLRALIEKHAWLMR